MIIRRAILVAATLTMFMHKAALADPAPVGALGRYINSFGKQLASGGLTLPAFEGASLESVENVQLKGGIKGTLCWLKNEKGRCAYILFSGEPESPNLLAFSETVVAPPGISELAASDKNAVEVLRRVSGFSFVTGAPLISSQKVRLGTKEIQLSSESCCLASIMNYLQNVKGMPLFGHLGYFASSDYIKQSPAQLSPEEQRKLADSYSKAMEKARASGWKPFDQEVSELLAKENIDPKTGKTAEERADIREKARELARPIRQKRLLNPVVPQERFDLLLSEMSELEGNVSVDASPGMRDALLLQKDYLGPNRDNLDQSVRNVFLTRGLKAEITQGGFGKASRSSSPCLLYNGDKAPGVLLGHLDIDGVEFAFVFFPETGTPNKMPLSAKVHLPDDKQAATALSDVPPEYADEAAAALRRLTATINKSIVVEDRVASFPKALAHGIHLVKRSALAQWQVFSIGEITPADNWGGISLQERKDVD